MKATLLGIRWKRLATATIFVFAMVILQFATIPFAHALTTDTWTGTAGDKKFNTAGNWSGNAVPSNGDILAFTTTSLTGTSGVLTLNNDITSLSVGGITVSGTTTSTTLSQIKITGNAITVSGSLSNSATTTGTVDNLYFSILTNITLGSDVTVHNVDMGSYDGSNTVTTQGHNLTIDTSTGCGVSLGVLQGSGNISFSGGTANPFGAESGSALSMASNPGYTGAISASSGVIIGNAGLLGSASGGTTLSGTASMLLFATANTTFTEPLTLSGTGEIGIEHESNSECRGDSSPMGPYSDTWSGPITLGSNFIYSGNDHNLTVTGTYTSNGHTFTASTSNGDNGTLTLPATAPDAPTSLTATPGSGQVGLTWTAPASNGGAAITDYKLEYKLSSSGSWTVFNDGTSTATTGTITGLTNGSSYDFRVSAINSVGTGSTDTVTSITPTATVTAPVTPATQLVATVNSTTKDLVLSWTAPTNDGGSPITDYLIQARLHGQSTWNTITHSAFNGTSFDIFSGLTDGSTYDFQISPINSIGTGPSVLISSVVYSAGNGTTGTLTNADGSGQNRTVTTPNTGAMTTLKNPFVITGAGVVSAAILLAAAKRRFVRSH